MQPAKANFTHTCPNYECSTDRKYIRQILDDKVFRRCDAGYVACSNVACSAAHSRPNRSFSSHQSQLVSLAAQLEAFAFTEQIRSRNFSEKVSFECNRSYPEAAGDSAATCSIAGAIPNSLGILGGICICIGCFIPSIYRGSITLLSRAIESPRQGPLSSQPRPTLVPTSSPLPLPRRFHQRRHRPSRDAIPLQHTRPRRRRGTSEVPTR